MQVDQTNAAVVSAIFVALADPRFTMRTPKAIRGTLEEVALPDAAILDIAAQLGLRFRRRASDGRLYIERPVTVEQAQEIVNKSQAVITGTAEPFELEFNTQPEVAAGPNLRVVGGNDDVDPDLMEEIESGLLH